MVSDANPKPSFVPKREQAVVPRAKITEYLLNLKHPEGSPKAKFFTSLGFSVSDPATFIEAALAHVRDNPFSEATAAPFGTV